jgi:AcrR family transcriptional regulator
VPRTEDQNQALRERSRERILEAALALFAREGYERTSVRMIAREAGVSQGLLYNYFEGKEGLLRALFERSMDDVRASFRIDGEDLDPNRRLEVYIRGCFEILRRRLDFWRISYGVRLQSGVIEGLGKGLAEWTAFIRATIEGFLRDAGFPNPEIEALILFALIDGVSQHYALDPDHYPLEEVISKLVEKYAGPEINRPEETGR